MGRKKSSKMYKYKKVARKTDLRSVSSKLNAEDKETLQQISECLLKVDFQNANVELYESCQFLLTSVLSIKNRCKDAHDLQVCEKLEKQLGNYISRITNCTMGNMTQLSTVSQPRVDMKENESNENENKIYHEIILGTQYMVLDDEPDLNTTKDVEKNTDNIPNINNQLLPINVPTDSQETFCSEIEKNYSHTVKTIPLSHNETGPNMCLNLIVDSQDLTEHDQATEPLKCKWTQSNSYSTQREINMCNAMSTEQFNATPEDPTNVAYSEQMCFVSQNVDNTIDPQITKINENTDISLDPVNNYITCAADVTLNGNFIGNLCNEQINNLQNIADNPNNVLHNIMLSNLNKNTEIIKIHDSSDQVQEIPTDITKNNIEINITDKNQSRLCGIDKNISRKVTELASIGNNTVQANLQQNTYSDPYTEMSAISNFSLNISNTQTALNNGEIINCLANNKKIQNNTGTIPKLQKNIIKDDKEFKFNRNISLIENIREFSKSVVNQVQDVRNTYFATKNSAHTVDQNFEEPTIAQNHESLFKKPLPSDLKNCIKRKTKPNAKDDPYVDLQKYINPIVLSKNSEDNGNLRTVTDLSMKDLIFNWNDIDSGKFFVKDEAEKMITEDEN